MTAAEGATLEELRDLARRSRRTAAWGGGALVGTLLVLFPGAALAARAAPAAWSDWIGLAALALAGLLFVRFAFVAGQERGAFRRVFRRIRAEREEVARRVPVQGAPAVAAAELSQEA